MDEPIRLVCPECDVVYRVKRYRPGKRYTCKNCSTPLRATLTERDALIKDYSETLQKQVRRLRAYEARLTRLGVAPETVADQ